LCPLSSSGFAQSLAILDQLSAPVGPSGLTPGWAGGYPGWRYGVNLDVDLFGSEAVVHRLKTRRRIFINGFIIPNPHEILAHQFLGVA
jgi:hypothetical protein